MIYEAEKGDFTLAATGDVMHSRRLSVFQEEQYLKMVNLLRSADCTFANLEGVVHDYEASPANRGGWHTRLGSLEELKWAGINLLSVANNHTYDYGEAGILVNINNLKKAGFVFSGAGRNLQEALMPGYMDTNRGRVALISVTDALPPAGRAGEQRPDLQGRPGGNCLDYEVVYTVDSRALEELRRMSTLLGLEEVKERLRTHGSRPPGTESEKRFIFTGGHMYRDSVVFEVGEKWGIKTRCSPKDLENNLKWVRAATKQADWVLVSLHRHAQGETPDLPADFEREFAYQCLDAGAHAILSHGPHQLRGIEIYHGKPILWSLGNFAFQVHNMERFPQDAYDRQNLGLNATAVDFLEASFGSFFKDPRYWESALATVHWEGGKFREVQMHPIDLGPNLPWPQLGRPLLAGAQRGGEILERLQKLCQPFGTKIQIKDGVGVIRP